ncbi:MAG TPA: DNA polymerase III subunit delta' [Paludibacteraceae bacterium]|nr:DNA polymerase III subunit delta' [Paludibacteraceae bacterium]HOL28653.1 DNA polymerase III subunit delta' [Paludibacteraceae bacterium]HON01741.1 DNA polymerase III subunit delta' [Paludibacteraceae bacterium]HPD58693.1 DNA polymerase III subunit delta' [Paludibacteraceae bacterium]HPQ12233.1 DNA polymerase III subunit delta' [Paludibacteraceae bacterium]
MLFSQVIGQEEVKKRLIRTVKEQKIPHAQLFYGPEGIGKLPLAIAYAQYICCEHPLENDACGVCPSCVQFGKLAHPDLHFVFPIIKSEKKKLLVCDDFMDSFRQIFAERIYFSQNDWYQKISGEAKQGMIYTSEGDEIIRKVNLMTYESRYKVMLIWLPERMNDQCANKLLKILEEPPENTVFLLVSNSPEEIIATILSRTQQVKIPRLSNEEIAEALVSRYQISENEAANAAQISEGSFLKALALIDENNVNRENFEHFVNIMRLAWIIGNKGDYASLKKIRQWSEEMAAASVGREGQKKFLSYAQRMIRENFIFNLHQPELNFMTSFEKEFSVGFAPFINETNAEDMMNEFALAERHIEQNVNSKMVFFDLALKITKLLKK